MNAVGPVGAGGATSRRSELPTPTDAPTLLPDPSGAALAGADPEAMLYLYESEDQTLGVAAGSRHIAALETERHQALDEEQQAIQRAVDAQRQASFWDNLGGVLGEVAKVAAVVASVAAAVASMGAGTPLVVLAVAGAVLSSASFIDGEVHALRSLGVDASTAGWVDTAMSIGGALCSLGVGAAAAGQTASTTASTLGQASAVVSGAAAVVHGASTIEVGHARALGDQAEADRVAAAAQSDHALRRIQLAVDETSASDEQSRRMLGTLARTDAIREQTQEGADAAVRG